MPSKAIVPRKVINHGKERWRVIVPKDLRKQVGKVFYFFPTAEDAKSKADQLTKDRGRIGEGFHALGQQDQALVLEALDRAGSARRLLLAVDRLESVEKDAKPRLLETVVDDFLAEKQSLNVRSKTEQNFRSSLKKFTAAMKAANVPYIANVTTENISKWLNANGWGVETRKTYLGHVRGLFLFAKDRLKCISDDPAVKIPYPKPEDKEVQVHELEQVKMFLARTLAMDPGLLGYVCLIYFGCLRPDESKRLKKENVDDDVIEINPLRTKTRQRRFVPINSTLKAWLDLKGIEIGGKNIRRRLQAIRDSFEKQETKKSRNGHMKTFVKYKRVDGKKAYAFPWCHDILRHTCCSFALPKFGATATAEAAGNSEKILVAKYRRRVRPEDVEKFWSITPETIRVYIESIDTSRNGAVSVAQCSPQTKSEESTTPSQETTGIANSLQPHSILVPSN